jgi:hypothetical protein
MRRGEKPPLSQEKAKNEESYTSQLRRLLEGG